MKTNHQNLKKMAAVAAVLVSGVACQNESAPGLEFSSEELLRSANIEVVSEEVDNIVEDVYYEDVMADMAAKSGSASKTEELSYLPACTIIVTQDMGGGMVEKTVDFGDGCQFTNGNVVRGMLHLSYQKNPDAASVIISVSFEDFYINDAQITGARTVERVLANENGNPQATIVFDITATWENGHTIQRTGTKVREWIAGMDTQGLWSDNVYLVTGEWTTVFWNGTIHQGKVVEPLRRELVCRFFVSGVLELDRNGHKGTLDYGNGSCDNEAVFTSESGIIRTVLLN